MNNLELATHPNTSQETLRSLATDKDYYVRYWVTLHPNTSLEILSSFATDENSYVRRGVARNPNTPEEIKLMVKAFEKFQNLAIRK